jgi:hypothetical protein
MVFLHYIALLNNSSTEINRSINKKERALQWTFHSLTVSYLVYACITLSLSHCGISPAVPACSSLKRFHGNGSLITWSLMVYSHRDICCSQTWQPWESSDVRFLSNPYPRRCVSRLCSTNTSVFCSPYPVCSCCHLCGMWPPSPAHGKLIFQKCNHVGFQWCLHHARFPIVLLLNLEGGGIFFDLHQTTWHYISLQNGPVFWDQELGAILCGKSYRCPCVYVRHVGDIMMKLHSF